MSVLSKQGGLKLFNMGIFLLPSAPVIAIPFLLISLILSALKRRDNYFEDIWNLPFIGSSLLMVLSCSIATITGYNIKFGYSSSFISWISLANWLPFFLCFWGFQPYLTSKGNREKCAISFVCGSIPVLISGFGQYWFNWHGPFEFMNGLIVWYQRPIPPDGGMSGLFNNANYAGALLTMVLPFSMALIYRKKINIPNKVIILLINLAIITGIIATNSRIAWLALMLSLPLYFGSIRSLLKIILTISLVFISINLFEWFGNLIKFLIPPTMFNNFDINLFVSDPRILIWKNSINYILEKPLFGIGGSGYATVKSFISKCPAGVHCEDFQHAHNMPLELAINYGLITSLIISSTIITLLFFGYKELAKQRSSQITIYNQNPFDRAWLVSTTIILVTHLVDIPYFDLRISLYSWILLAGIRGLILESKLKNIENF